jgi:hypothetical protein
MNMVQYEEAAEKSASDSKALKEKTEKIDKAVREAEALETEKPGAALLAYKKILEQDKYNSKVIGKIRSLEKKLSEGSLFGAEEALSVVASPAKGEPVRESVQEVQAAAVSKPEEVTATPAVQPSGDMFLQAVNAAGAGKPSNESPADKAAAAPAFDPAVFSQFQQFMAMQEAAKQAQ